MNIQKSLHCLQTWDRKMTLLSVCPFLLLFLSFPFLLIRLYSFRAVLGSQQSWGDGTEISHIFSVPAHTQPPSLSTSPPEWGHLLQLINPHWHLIITQSPLWLMVNSMVRSLCCPFCGFRHTHNDMYPSLWYFFFFSPTFNTYQKFMQYLLKTKM